YGQGLLGGLGDVTDNHRALDRQAGEREGEGAHHGELVASRPLALDLLRHQVLAVDQQCTAWYCRVEGDQVVPGSHLVVVEGLAALDLDVRPSQLACRREQEIGPFGGDTRKRAFEVLAQERWRGSGTGGPDLVDALQLRNREIAGLEHYATDTAETEGECRRHERESQY